MRRDDLPWLVLLFAWGAWVLLPGLAHPSFWNWDEAVHQAAARGVYDTFFTPHIYVEHLYPGVPLGDWWSAGIWLHKPILPFWLGAAVMHLIGVSPLGLRLCSLAGMLLAAGGLYLLLRTQAARPWAALVAGAFLALPFGWRMVQGYQFGDVTDATLAGLVVLSFWLLLQAVERGSRRFALAAGAATGLAFLCKSALALTPLGTAAAFCLFGSIGFCRGLRWRSLALFLAALLAVAAPWEIACAIRWPALHRLESLHTFGHITGHTVENWIRPWDALFNQINEAELAPLPPILPLVAGGWLLIRAARRREPAVVPVAIWLWAEWVVLTVARVKVPAVAWTAAPAVFFALGLAVLDAFGRPVLASALAGALAAPLLAPHWPALARARLQLPGFFVETRLRPGLAEGALVVALFLSMGIALRLARRRLPGLVGAAGWLIPAAGQALAASGFALAVSLLALELPGAQARTARDYQARSLTAYAKEAGEAIGWATPKASVLFLGIDRDPPDTFTAQDAIFWSGRMAYRRPPDPDTARRKGYHPYLLSPAAQPFREVPGVPAASWLRAYDLDAPAPFPPLPAGAAPVGLQVGSAQVLGWAAAPGDGRRGRYAFFVRAAGPPLRIGVVFQTRHGSEPAALDPGASLLGAGEQGNLPWFVVPALGPPPGELQGISFPGGRPLPASPAGPPAAGAPQR